MNKSPGSGADFLRISMVVIDDDSRSLAWIESAFRRPDLEILPATDTVAGLDLVRQRCPHIVLVNPSVPCSPGDDLLQCILQIDPTIRVVLMPGTAYSNVSAMAAIDRGACDYIPKPLPMERLRQRIDLLIQEAERRETIQRLDQELSEVCRFEGCVGRSQHMLDVFSRIARVAPHFRTALIGGLPGTGKEMAARALHRFSPASPERFFPYNCASQTADYALGEVKSWGGIFHAAQGGTIFLAEIDRLSMPVQGKLVRFLRNSNRQKTNVRVVASTSRDLQALTRERTFRPDLLQLLSTVELHLPALKQRMEDLPLLIQCFLKEFAWRHERRVLGLTYLAERALYAYHWPANIRELKDAIEHGAMATKSNRIDAQDLPAAVQNPSMTDGVDLVSSEENQYRHARRVLNFFKGDKDRTAATLEVSRATLYRLLARSRSVDA